MSRTSLLQEACRQPREGRSAGRIFGERVPPGFRAGRTKVGVGAGVSASTQRKELLHAATTLPMGGQARALFGEALGDVSGVRPTSVAPDDVGRQHASMAAAVASSPVGNRGGTLGPPQSGRAGATPRRQRGPARRALAAHGADPGSIRPDKVMSTKGDRPGLAIGGRGRRLAPVPGSGSGPGGLGGGRPRGFGVAVRREGPVVGLICDLPVHMARAVVGTRR